MEGLFERGVEEFNSRHFFEAHDIWEELWMDTRGSHRLFYQGLIQMAVGFYHLFNGNFRGACSQFGKAIAKLDNYLPSYHGVDTQQLVGRIQEFLSEAELLRSGNGGVLDAGRVPQIRLQENERIK